MASRDRDMGRKYEPGSVKRNKSAKRKVLEGQLRNSLTKFLKSETAADSSSSSSPSHPVSAVSAQSEQCSLQLPLSTSPPPLLGDLFSTPPSPEEEGNHHPETEESDGTKDIKDVSDPYLWPNHLTQSERSRLVEKGPIHVTNKPFPKNESGRHFSSVHYTRQLSNGEQQKRRWLLYSDSNDSVHCFACRLFSHTCGSALGSGGGTNDWQHLSVILKKHENNKDHRQCMLKWFELEKRLNNNNTIDRETEAQIKSEAQRWKDIMERLLAIVQFLASHNLAFRGHKEIITLSGSDRSGNFLDLVKLIAKFDPTLREHLCKVFNKTITRNHYLGKETQNEFIQLMASHVISKITDKLIKNKYYAIILDCTRDISRVEQLSVILRTVDKETAEIKEHFIGFVAVETTTAEGLTEYLLTELNKLGLSLENCRGQSYDNGSNMRGVHSGVQRRILNMNPLAFFVPCGSHSWNLVLGDAALSSVQAQTFFGTLQRLYTVFSCSSQRWSILKQHVHISVKPLSETRWECIVESVKAVRYQLSNVCDALSSLRENSTDCLLTSECQSLENEITTFEFIVSLVVWYDILVNIHCISKIWQSPHMNLDVAVNHLTVFLKWLDEYRERGFESALVTAREVAEEVGLYEMAFKTMRPRRKKKFFDYESNDETPELSPKDKFKIDYFNVVVDQIRTSCEPRFEALKRYESTFGFLYRIMTLSTMSDKELMDNCKDLQVALSVRDQHDIEGMDLFEELKIFSHVMIEVEEAQKNKIKNEQSGIVTALKYIVENNLSEIYPNISIALRIVATIPVTVAAAERSFSKLKLIKTYLRNTMTQDRLSALAILSIENELSSSLDFSALIEDFSQKKSRRVHF